jgi:preprotein translocase subunit SecB
MSEQIAKFRLSKFTITKSVVEIKEAEKISDNLNAEFNQSGAIEENKNIFKYTLESTIKDETENLFINTIVVGIFEFDNNLPEEMKKSFFNVNAPAIIFPYVRAYVSSITGLSGIKPIILPTLNLSNRGGENTNK